MRYRNARFPDQFSSSLRRNDGGLLLYHSVNHYTNSVGKILGSTGRYLLIYALIVEGAQRRRIRSFRHARKASHVSAKTREKVEAAMAELNYIPNRVAQQLAGLVHHAGNGLIRDTGILCDIV